MGWISNVCFDEFRQKFFYDIGAQFLPALSMTNLEILPVGPTLVGCLDKSLIIIMRLKITFWKKV